MLSAKTNSECDVLIHRMPPGLSHLTYQQQIRPHSSSIWPQMRTSLIEQPQLLLLRCSMGKVHHSGPQQLQDWQTAVAAYLIRELC